MPSTGDASSAVLAGGAAPLLAAARQLADRGVYGLIWFAPDLVVESRFGRIVEFVDVGEPVTNSIFALSGLEADILQLKDHPDRMLVLPDVSLVSSRGRLPRATISVVWSKEDKAFIVLFARADVNSDLELELSTQMRARLIAESELAAKSRELERANTDLEAYASIISHDLQSPMRVLRYALDDLEAALGTPDGEVQLQISRLRELSRRMTGMLSGLLDYASVPRTHRSWETVDMSCLLAGIVQSLHVPQGFRVISSGDWPRVETEVASLDIVLRNLIDNAIKHHDRSSGLITLSARQDAEVLIITVGDDGPGIAPNDRETIFLPFRKLQSDVEKPGQGLGLAVVRRMVESAAGSINVESAAPASRGTAFIVRWPVRSLPR